MRYPTEEEIKAMAKEEEERFQQELDDFLDAQIEEAIYGE